MTAYSNQRLNFTHSPQVSGWILPILLKSDTEYYPAYSNLRLNITQPTQVRAGILPSLLKSEVEYYPVYLSQVDSYPNYFSQKLINFYLVYLSHRLTITKSTRAGGWFLLSLIKPEVFLPSLLELEIDSYAV